MVIFCVLRQSTEKPVEPVVLHFNPSKWATCHAIWSIVISSYKSECRRVGVSKHSGRGFLLLEARDKCGLPGRDLDQEEAGNSRIGKRAEKSLPIAQGVMGTQ